jgi:hypothetical protein
LGIALRDELVESWPLDDVDELVDRSRRADQNDATIFNSSRKLSPPVFD